MKKEYTWSEWIYYKDNPQYTNLEEIYPPIIDNNIGAFSRESTMEINFYFQNSTEDVRSDYVIVKIESGGKGFFKDGTNQRLCRCQLSNLHVSSSSKNTLYKVVIRASDIAGDKTEFDINTPMTVSVKSLRNYLDKDNKNLNIQALIDNKITLEEALEETQKTGTADMSNFSDSVIKYAIAQPVFTMWGGLTADETESKNSLSASAAELKKLSGSEKNVFSINSDTYRVKGQLTFEQEEAETILETDVLLWYQIKFYNTTDTKFPEELEVSADREYLDRTWDLTNKSFVYTFDYDFTKLIDKDVRTLRMVVLYATRKGYMGTAFYEFQTNVESGGTLAKTNDLISFLDRGQLIVTTDSYKGTALLQATLRSFEPSIISGMLVYQRAEVGKNLSWETVSRQLLSLEGNGKQTAVIYEDPTIEAGKLFKYRIQFYYEEFDLERNNWGLVYAYNNAESDQPVLLLIEDIFLMTKDTTLKIRYNPEITTYKRNVVDVISPTLGGAYPFVRRNGAQKYRTFNINGWISYKQEIEDIRDYTSIAAQDSLARVVAPYLDILQGELPSTLQITDEFISTLAGDEDITVATDAALILKTYLDPLEYDEFSNSLFLNKEQEQDIVPEYYKNLSTYDKERIYEKIFREKVLDFLYKDQILLFKSLPEGNMFIRLTNVSLTPNKQLDRNVYSFSAQAVEVLPPIADNYEKYFSDISEGAVYTVKQLSVYTTEGELVQNNAGVYLLQTNSDYGYASTSLPAFNLTKNVSELQYYAKDVEGNEVWTSEIEDSYTYYTEIGQEVKIETITLSNGNQIKRFAPGSYPKTRTVIVNNESPSDGAQAKNYTVTPDILNSYDVSYEFE